MRYLDSDALRSVQNARFLYYDAIPAHSPVELNSEFAMWIEIVHSKAKPNQNVMRVWGDNREPDYQGVLLDLMSRRTAPVDVEE